MNVSIGVIKSVENADRNDYFVSTVFTKLNIVHVRMWVAHTFVAHSYRADESEVIPAIELGLLRAEKIMTNYPCNIGVNRVNNMEMALTVPQPIVKINLLGK